MKTVRMQIAITSFAIIVVIVHLAWPTLAIDGITLALLLMAIIPWLAPMFKSLEFPGGWKVEFQDLQKTKVDADKAGLLAPIEKPYEPSEYPFLEVVEDDPNLALAGLRIEIEIRLQKLGLANDLSVNRKGIGSLMRMLFKEGVLSNQEYSVLNDMVGLLDSAVHGATVDNRALEWAMDVGPRLLKSLDERIQNNE
ncbi:MAG: hypothetical protein PVF83_03255 [Anaerolineales bacterium]